MKSLSKKWLLNRLIRDDLINWKLVYTFEDLGIDAGGFSLYASETIMKLLKVDLTEESGQDIHDRYLRATEKVKQFNVHASSELLDALTKEIYRLLKQLKKEQKMLRSATS